MKRGFLVGTRILHFNFFSPSAGVANPVDQAQFTSTQQDVGQQPQGGGRSQKQENTSASEPVTGKDSKYRVDLLFCSNIILKDLTKYSFDIKQVFD